MLRLNIGRWPESSHWRFSLPVLLLLTSLVSSSALAMSLGTQSAQTAQSENFLASDPLSFSLYVDSRNTNRYGGHITVNVGYTQLQDLPETLLPQADEVVDVVIVIPKSASTEAQIEFIDSIRTQMSAKYPGAKYRIQQSYVDTKEERELLEQQRTLARQMKDQAYGNYRAPALSTSEADQRDQKLVMIDKLAGEIESAIDAEIQASRDMEKSWIKKALRRLSDTHPYNTVVAAKGVGITKLATASLVLIGKYGLNPASLLIGLTSGMISATFGYNAVAYSNFCTDHQFPWFKDNALVRAYNSSGFVKSWNINMFRSVGISFGLRMLAHLTHQVSGGHPVENPWSLDFFLPALGIAIPEVAADALLDDGARGMELKRAANHQSRSYLTWTVGILDTIMHGLFRSNAVREAYIVGTLSVGLKLGIWAAGKFTKTPTRRFVFISNQIAVKETASLPVLPPAPPKDQRTVVKTLQRFGIYFLNMGRALTQSISNRRAGRFSVSDLEMVKQDLSLSESWNLSLTPEQMDRVQNDRDLTQDQFAAMLRLRDTDRGIVNDLWAIRNREQASLRKVSLTDLCAEALGLNRDLKASVAAAAN